MKQISPLLWLVTLALSAVFFLTPQAETQQDSVKLAAPLLQQPIWDSVKIKDNNDTMLLRVEPGQRFVLTDMWFLSVEGAVISSGPADRIWLESRVENRNKRFVIFDSPRKALDLPLRWQTGVAIPGGHELWINYKSSPRTDALRRVHFTGYLEADMPASTY